VVVTADEITDDLNHGDDDLYASCEMDPFDIELMPLSPHLIQV
jgi:hypothetical protein